MTGSSKSREPNRLVVVRERERVAALARLGFGGWLAAAEAIVAIAQTERHEFSRAAGS